MRKSKFTDAQKAHILKHRADGHPVAEIGPKAESLEAIHFNWNKKCEGLLPDEIRRLKQLEHENAQLKKLVADLFLDKAVLQDVLCRKF